MKVHIDDEMEKRGIDWLLISGPRHLNPDIIYLIGNAHILQPIVVKKRGEPPLVIHNAMERGEVEKYDLNGLDYNEMVPPHVGGEYEKWLFFYRKLFDCQGIKGRVAFYGAREIHQSFFIMQEILKAHPAIEAVNERESSIFQHLRITKDEQELAVLRDVASRTCRVMEGLMGYLKKNRLRDGVLVDDEEKKITLGDLRRRACIIMAGEGLIADEKPIISMGREAGIPHSTGDNSMIIEAGKPIIIDIFPRCTETGYMCDMTRTVCVGKASFEAKELFQAVHEAQELALSKVKAGSPLALPDREVSEFFATLGFPTIFKDLSTRNGYVHSLGHGVGLQLHEKPRLSVFNDSDEPGEFLPGMVFTVEPGLYFPDEAIGVRLEDLIAINADGRLENLTPVPKYLEIEPEG